MTTTYARAAITGRSKNEVLRRLYAEQRAGRIHSAGEGITLITKGPHAGEYAVPVLIIAPGRAMPIWQKVAVVGSLCLASAATVVGLLAWLLISLSGAALVVLCAAAVLALAARVKFAHIGRRVRVTTTTRVDVL